MKITKKSITLLLAGLLCASNSFSQTYPKQDGVIRLLTYNTHYCKGGTDPGSLNDLNTKRFANILKALDADVVALQELDSAANGRWKRVLLDDIAKWSELDYVQVYGIAADYDGGSVGNGTLVKRWLPIKKIKKMKLSSDVGRILIRTDFEDFSFMSTHLDLDDKHRMNEAAAICTELDYIRKPVFLAGDMNDSHRWKNLSFSVFLEDFQIFSDTEGNTIPGREENTACIDYILFHDYKNSGIQNIESHIVRTITIDGQTVDLNEFSDHYSVYDDIKIPGMSAIQQTTKNNLEIRLQLSSCELSVFSAEPINEIEIFSSNGCLIQRNQGENLQTTNVPQLPAGIYLVKVKSEEGYTVTKKILKR